MELFHDKPACAGAANAIRRARQLTEIRWTPAGAMPCGRLLPRADGTGSDRVNYFGQPHRPQRGMAYSSARIYEKMVGYNVSFETFVTAAANPNSVLFTRPLHGRGKGMFSYYGTVCSCFVSYALNIPFRLASIEWGSYEDVTPVAVTPDDIDAIALCDLVNKPGNHVALVTDILRDAEGHIRKLEVSESKSPVCLRIWYTPREFAGYWLANGYGVWRYKKLDTVPYTPDPFAPVEGDPETEPPRINRTLLPDFGNKANYRCGEEPVELSVFEPGWDYVEVTKPDGTLERCEIENGKAVYLPAQPGFYTACCAAGEKKSDSVAWCATRIDVTLDKAVYRVGEPMDIRFRNALEGDDVFFAVTEVPEKLTNRTQRFLTAQEAASGALAFTRDVKRDKPGEYAFYVIAHGKYGAYKSAHFTFRVEE